ncbi:PhoX family phosphatase [Sphingomonas sp. IC-11]|uniref:PhoX family protein n=1 Tax=Sphingomonas sp. IC-11 TaxID=2898528 RepID=UPI001E4CEB0B|nr:alkaline phosphatase PhoX [Sphingomonas sp. IC-11]MCD2316530.1 PhoX family phosphatase [Sphingomonas sp. IC-11]
MTDSTFLYDDGDIDTNRSANGHLNDLIAQRYSRRQTLRGGLSAMTTAVFGGVLLAGCDDETITSEPVKVSAGSAVATTAGKTVTLQGTANTGAQSIGWVQVSGPSVTLSGTSGTTATFIAPAVSTATPLVFRFTGVGAAGDSATADTTVTVSPATLDFAAVAKNRNDLVTVPAGYTVTVLYRLGDPINASTPAYANDGTDTNFAARAGDHHDGMSFFGLAATGTSRDPAGSTRGLLVLNHENITESYLHARGQTTTGGVRPEAEAIKEIEAHGVSVIEVTRGASAWSYVQASALNRRITPNTPMAFNGPARGHALLRTLYSKEGTQGRGTINNCANGTMPWGTYATAEENWAGYFRRDRGDAAVRIAAGQAKENASLSRYGISEGRAGNYGWTTVTPSDPSSTVFRKWNATAVADAVADGTADFRHEPFQYGWIVEIDPYNPQSTPRKRTALGRMNHEGVEPSRMVAGVRPAFYMGDDAQNEYIYKFVSSTPWSASDANAADRLAVGDKYLDAGTLYVAKFNADGSGQWLALTFGSGPLTSGNATYPFADQADVLINARIAADLLGATPMDRPEWTAVNPANGEMYCTLTNNSSRSPARTDAANPRAYVDPRTDGRSNSAGNVNGHVIRLRENGDTTEAVAFTWDVYAFGSGSDLNKDNINLSGLDDSNDFSSPDGLWFSLPTNVAGQGASPVMWLQTDDGAFTDVTNNQMLAAIPGRVGDGGTKTVNNATPAGTSTATTRVGKAPGATLKRFLVGPKECEITGITSTPDGKALFVNIQHPGENGGPDNITSNWPASQGGSASPGTRPRSATIVITRQDGGLVGI